MNPEDTFTRSGVKRRETVDVELIGFVLDC
jgi:hypothetical protein